jgi:hypothetical protein
MQKPPLKRGGFLFMAIHCNEEKSKIRLNKKQHKMIPFDNSYSLA